MVAKVFIDGVAGTTGLEIRQRLAGRRELSLVELPEHARKSAEARKTAANESDLVILCLPDQAARDAAAAIENPAVKVIDASTAHRVADGWTYGFPELEADQSKRISAARRVSNPGCYATGFLALVRPLVREGIVATNQPLSVNAISGYSGGGRAMIDEFENTDSPIHSQTIARTYALSLAHKHVPEMRKYAGLEHAPIFSPAVARFYRGMIVEVPLHLWALPTGTDASTLYAVLADAYAGKPLVEVAGLAEARALPIVDAELMKNTNKMRLFVFANEVGDQARLVAVLDNLGKGASGAAVQNLNLMLGLDETAGL